MEWDSWSRPVPEPEVVLHNNTRMYGIYFDMGLEDAGPRSNETHGEDGVVEAVKVRQVAPILVLPHIDVAVNRQPGTGHLGKRKTS